MKQTAVEWLVDKVIEYQQKGLKISKNLDKLLIEQAKEMQKQQIIDAWLKGVEDEGNPHGHTYFYGEIDLAEKYYNETFN